MIKALIGRINEAVFMAAWIADRQYRTGKEKLESFLFVLFTYRSEGVELYRWRILRKSLHHQFHSVFARRCEFLHHLIQKFIYMPRMLPEHSVHRRRGRAQWLGALSEYSARQKDGVPLQAAFAPA